MSVTTLTVAVTSVRQSILTIHIAGWDTKWVMGIVGKR